MYLRRGDFASTENPIMPEARGAAAELHEPERRPISLVATSAITHDAIVLTNDTVITVQITIASKHDAKSIAFQNLF